MNKVTIDNIHQKMIEAGVKIDHHESDLYVPSTKVANAIVSEYEFRDQCKMFYSSINGGMGGERWIDIPFAYDPSLEQQIKETAASGSVGAHSIAITPSRMGAPKRRDLKSFMAKFYGSVTNTLKLKPVPVSFYKFDKKKDKVSVVSSLTENFNLDSVLAQLSSFENKTNVSEEDIVTYGVEDDKGNLMKVTILKTQSDDFEAYISAYLTELKNFKDNGVDLDDISLAELLYKLKDLFDIRDVEFPNIPEDIVYNADEASDQVENMPNDDILDDEFEDSGDEFGDDGMDDEFEEGGDEFGDDGMGDEFADDESVEDFAEPEEGGSLQSILAGVIDMLKAQAETEKAKAEAETEKARATQAEYAARAAEATLQSKEELVAMQAEKDEQKANEKRAKEEADLATYRYRKSKGMVDDVDAKFEGFNKAESLLLQALLMEDEIGTSVMNQNKTFQVQLNDFMEAIAAAKEANNMEEVAALQEELAAFKAMRGPMRRRVKARRDRRDAITKFEDGVDPDDPTAQRDQTNQRRGEMQGTQRQMAERVEVISEDEYEQLDEAAKRQFKRYNNKFVRKFRCYSGPRDGKIVTKASGCGMRKDPLKVRRGKRAARIKKGSRIRKTQLTKRKAASKRLVRMNKLMRGD